VERGTRSLTKVVKSADVVVREGCCAYDGDLDELKEDRHPEPQAGSENNAERLIQKAKNDARDIIENANSLAGKILERAGKKEKADREKARSEGYMEGLRQGRIKAEEQCEQALEELKQLILGIEREKASLLAEFEERIKDLSLEIAEKIIDRELELTDDVFLSLYKNAVSRINGCQWIKVTVSEKQAEFMTAHADLLLSMVKDAKEIRILPMKDAPDGTLLIETQDGFIDAGIDSQIKRLKLAFINRAGISAEESA